MGIMPSADVLGKAGISMNEAQNFISAVLASRTKKSSGGSGKSSSSGKKKTDDGNNETKYKYSDLGDYAKGLYTDIMKKGYSPEDIDEIITREYHKKYIKKKEADILAGILIG